GITSSAQAVLGAGSGDPAGASSLGAIKVLGIPVLNLDQVVGMVPGTTKSIAIPATGISLNITRGVPQIGMNTATQKSVSVSALDVSLKNDGNGLLGSLLSAGSTSKPIAEVALANSVATASIGAPAAASTPTGSTPSTPADNPSAPAITPAQGPTPPSTGMFGPASFAAAAARIAGAAWVLRDHGVVRGSVVMATTRNTDAYLFTWLAAVRLGALLVTVDPRSGAAELAGLAGQTRPHLVVTDAEAWA